MTTPIGSLQAEVSVNGTPLAAATAARLTCIQVRRGLCVIGRATLRLADDGFAVAAGDTFAVGADVTITVVNAGTIFSGTVTGVSLEQSLSGTPELTVTADDAGYRLTRGMSPRTFLEMTYSDVLSQLAGEAGMTTSIAATTPALPYQLVTGSALAYLNEVARRTGLIWFVEDGRLTVQPPAHDGTTVQLSLGTESLWEFGVRASGLRPTAVTVSGWDATQQLAVAGDSQALSDGPDAAFVRPYVGDAPATSLTAAAAVLLDPLPTTATDAQQLADALLSAEASASVVARGTCPVTTSLKPGVTVVVSNAGPASGNYRVSEVEHRLSSRGFVTKFVAGPLRPTGLVDTLGRGDPDPGLVHAGLVVAVVTNNNDDENLGRVKVQYTALHGQIESAWARVLGVGAGGTRGMVFQPEVNDEVLVGFEFGDSHRPVVLGGLHSKTNGLPEAGRIVANGKVDYRRITSRLGHVVEFADGAGPDTQHILLKNGSADGHTIRLGADSASIQVASGKPITIKAGTAKFEIDASGNVTIEGNKITLKAQTDVEIGGVNITAKAQAQANLQGAIVAVKAQGSAELSSSGVTAVKGTMVQLN